MPSFNFKADEDGIIQDNYSINPELQGTQYPELTAVGEYLVALFVSTGMSKETSMGLEELSWPDLVAWREANNYCGVLGGWQMETLFNMSRAFTRQYHVSSKPDAKPPFVKHVEMTEQTRKVVSDSVDAFFKGMLQARGKK